MKRMAKKNWVCRIRMIAFSLVMVLVLGLSVDGFSIVSNAQSQGKVTASSANIRKEPNPSSQAVGSAERDASVTINHQITGTDGKVWYQVFVNAETLGYIRSDLVSITDGTTPQTVTSSGTTTTTTTTNTNETPATVTEVNPVSASVTGGKNVRVRSNASTTSQIVTTVASGSALTVNGKADGSDGNVWYQVAFISNGANVTGFIRSDYVALSGELTPVTETPSVPETPAENTQPEEQPQEPEETKAWETQLQGDRWYLLDMEKQGQYAIDDMFNAVKQNGDAFEESQKTVKSQKIVIVILVIIIIALSAGVALLIFKIKDMNDEEYFSQVERDTIRRRSAERPQGSQKVMHTVGADKKPAPGGQSGRPAGGQPQQGRPMGGQPQGNRPAGARPSGGQPQGNRPTGGQPQQGRPMGGQPQGNRPAGARPSGGQPQQGRPVGAHPQGERPAAPRPTASQPQANNSQNAARKSKNFMADDDEFEFEFLNWDGEEQQ